MATNNATKQVNPTRVVTGLVRFSFVNVFSPKANDLGGEPKYSMTILLPKTDTVTKAKVDEAIRNAADYAKTKRWGGKIPAKLQLPVYDGDGTRDNGEPFGEECQGMWVFTARSSTKPQVVDANNQDIIDPSQVYSGAWGRVSFNFYGYDVSGSRGIACGLGNVQFLKDGERLSGGASAEEDFGDTPEEYKTPVADNDPLAGLYSGKK